MVDAQVKAVANSFQHPTAYPAEEAGLLLNRGGIIRHDHGAVSLNVHAVRSRQARGAG